MSNRTAVIASAIAIGVVSLSSIIFVPAIAAPAAEEPAAENECLSAPKAATPAGAHWYYRVEKGTKRKCWYLSDAGAKVSKPAAAATTSPPVAETDAPAPNKPMRNSVANARAELTAGSPDQDRSLAESTWPPLTPADQSAVREDNQTAAIQPAPEPANTQGWSIASRWPESKTVAAAEDQPAASAPEPAQPAPALTPDRLAAAAATVAATPAQPAQPAPVAQQSNVAGTTNDENFPIRILLSVLVCALALAAIIGPMIFRYIRPRKDERAPAQRRPIWDMDTSSETVRQDNPRMGSPAHYVDAPPEPRVLDEAVDELENVLARASRRSAA